MIEYYYHSSSLTLLPTFSSQMPGFAQFSMIVTGHVNPGVRAKSLGGWRQRRDGEIKLRRLLWRWRGVAWES
jgi:hypothetical protein